MSYVIILFRETMYHMRSITVSSSCCCKKLSEVFAHA